MKSRIIMTRTVTTVEEVELVIDNNEFQYIMDSNGILLSDLDPDNVQYALDAAGHEFSVTRSDTKECYWENLRLQGTNE